MPHAKPQAVQRFREFALTIIARIPEVHFSAKYLSAAEARQRLGARRWRSAPATI